MSKISLLSDIIDRALAEPIWFAHKKGKPGDLIMRLSDYRPSATFTGKGMHTPRAIPNYPPNEVISGVDAYLRVIEMNGYIYLQARSSFPGRSIPLLSGGEDSTVYTGHITRLARRPKAAKIILR